MKKRFAFLLVLAMFFSMNIVPINAYATSDWSVENGTYGSATKVDENISLLEGSKSQDAYGRHVGPYTKKDMKFFHTNNGVVDFNVNIKLDPSSMATGEHFTATAALNQSSTDTYVSELRILFTKLANGSIQVQPEVPWVKNTFTYEIKDAGIYSLKWEYTKNSTKVQGKFKIEKRETVLLEAINEDMDTILGSIPAYDKADSGRYLWFCDIAVNDGIYIYDQLPENQYKPPVINNDITLDKDAIEDIILASDAQAKLELTVDDKVQNVTLPKDLLEIAANAGQELVVEIKNAAGASYAWYFNGSDINQDLNLVMNQVSVKDMEGIKDVVKEGLVLDFQHVGTLPTGTKVMFQVGDSFEADDKVKVSYFNETTNTLEETKEYTVSSNQDILIDIADCSKYVVEKVLPTLPDDGEDEGTQTPPPSTDDDTTPDSENPSKPNTSGPETGDNSSIAPLLLLFTISGFMVFTLQKKTREQE